MSIQSLAFQHFRCFSYYQVDCHPRFNYIVGENGTGKTALLEGLSLLCRGRSFRSKEITPLIQTHAENLIVTANLVDAQTIGLQKSKTTPTLIRINAQPCYKTSELAIRLPSQVIYQDLFQIIDAGPRLRRQLLDWGVFHLEPAYHDTLKQYKQILKQRNALLKTFSKQSDLAMWSRSLNDLAAVITKARLLYVEKLSPLFKTILQTLSTLNGDLIYLDGWNTAETNRPLIEVLEASIEADRLKQYTQHGPHHADLMLLSTHGKVKQFLSRGQQKIMLLALKLAQATLLNQPCVFLWDDICAELDDVHLMNMAGLMQSLPGQFFMTGIHLDHSSLAQLNPGKVIALPTTLS